MDFALEDVNVNTFNLHEEEKLSFYPAASPITPNTVGPNK